jgi:hypothetical protein
VRHEAASAPRLLSLRGLKAVYLRQDGSANPTSLTIQGVSNENGTLTSRGVFARHCARPKVVI